MEFHIFDDLGNPSTRKLTAPLLIPTTYASGSTGVSMLRRDGFASMDGGARPSTLTTRPVTFSGKFPFVNVAAKDGELARNCSMPMAK